MQAQKSNLDRIRAAASGRWEFVVSTVAGISQSVLDGKHHACPSGKCSSKKDAFRAFDDFSKSGGTVCNQCGKHADGFATLQWLTGRPFKEVVNVVGSLLGVDAAPSGQSVDPAYHLKWIDWNDSLASTWCLAYKPIIPEAIKLAGGRMAVYRGKYTVIALPVWIANKANIVGWRVWNIRGKLPKYGKTKDDKVEWVKSKLTYGSQPGVVGTMAAKATEVWKVEGETDMLALLSINPRASVICNASGAGENPTKFHWLKEPFQKAGSIFVLHDADNPGQEGAERWTKYLAAMLGPKCQVANVELPYPIQATKGKDLRDWIGEGNRYETLMERAQKFAPENSIKVTPNESEDDPHRLAQANIDQYEQTYSGKLVYWQGGWLKWKNGCYHNIDSYELEAKVNASIRKEFERGWRIRQEKGGEEANQPIRKVTSALVKNTIAAMASKCYLPSKTMMPSWLPTESSRNLLSMQNGILDLDGLFAGNDVSTLVINHSPHWFSTIKLSYQFDPMAACPMWMRFLQTSLEGDIQRIHLLQEWAGYLLIPHNNYQKFMALEGEGKNGKTVYFAGLSAMLGEQNISRVSLENFGGRFDLASTVGKMVNMCSDVSSVIDPNAESVLRAYTGGESMEFDRKNQDKIKAKPSAKLMFAWNNTPRFSDKSNAVWRRLIIVPFTYEVPDSDRVYGMDESDFWIRSGEMPGILNWAINGMIRLQKNNRFTESEVSSSRMKSMKLDLNPARAFLQEELEAKDGDWLDCGLVYDKYSEWCKTNGNNPMSSSNFGKEVKREFPKSERKQKRDDYKRFWVYEGIRFVI